VYICFIWTQMSHSGTHSLGTLQALGLL